MSPAQSVQAKKKFKSSSKKVVPPMDKTWYGYNEIGDVDVIRQAFEQRKAELKNNKQQ